MKTFDYDGYCSYEKSAEEMIVTIGFRTVEDISVYDEKKILHGVGGFDLIYPSPFICDWDFFLKRGISGLYI